MNSPSLKMLVVDDDESHSSLVREACAEKQPTVEVSAVNTGDGALAHLRRCGAPDLILLDLDMPDHDGFWVLKAIRAEPAFKSIPVVVLSGRDDGESVRQAYSGGANLYIRKPDCFARYLEVLGFICQLWSQFAELPR